MNSKFSSNNKPIKLYRHPLSGHCHRVELMLSLLNLPYETIDIDLLNAEHKSADFLKINPFGQVPAIDDNGVILSDSTAIIVYLDKKYNDGYEWFPQEPEKYAQVQRWLAIAAGQIAYGPCSVRLVKVFGADLNWQVAEQITKGLFTVVESLLSNDKYLANNTLSLADIAAYSYIAHVPEGGVSLAPYPAIRAWLSRIEDHPRFIAMAPSPLPTN